MRDKRKVIISVAPVGGVPEDSNQVVLLPEKLCKDIADCAAEGASLVHLHVKDVFGHPTAERGLFDSVLEVIRKQSNIILQGSTGGDGTLSAEERCTALQNSDVETASLNMGSTNFFGGVYINTPDEIRYWARRMMEKGIKPEFEIFSPEMIEIASRLYAEKLVHPPYNFGICVGIPWAMPADARYLYMCSQLIPEGANWGLIEHARSEFSLVAVALSLGACWIRVGQEDAPVQRTGGSKRGNSELVREARQFVESLGYEIASPGEARKILGVES